MVCQKLKAVREPGSREPSGEAPKAGRRGVSPEVCWGWERRGRAYVSCCEINRCGDQ